MVCSQSLCTVDAVNIADCIAAACGCFMEQSSNPRSAFTSAKQREEDLFAFLLRTSPVNIEPILGEGEWDSPHSFRKYWLLPFLICVPVQCLNSVAAEKGVGEVNAVCLQWAKGTGIEGKDNKACFTLKLCDADVGWMVCVPFHACASPLNTSDVCPSNFVHTEEFDC